ncbi:MAG: hypothetical protein ACT4O6_12650 [Reyranella sp.]
MRDAETDSDMFGRADIALAADIVAEPRLRWLVAVAAGVVRVLPHEHRQCRDVLAELAEEMPHAAKALRLARHLAALGVINELLKD